MDEQRIFQEIRAALIDWIRQKSTGTDKNFTLTILADQEDFLRAEFLYPDRAAELVVCADPVPGSHPTGTFPLRGPRSRGIPPRPFSFGTTRTGTAQRKSSDRYSGVWNLWTTIPGPFDSASLFRYWVYSRPHQVKSS